MIIKGTKMQRCEDAELVAVSNQRSAFSFFSRLRFGKDAELRLLRRFAPRNDGGRCAGRNGRGGFTLVELLAVVLIISLLAAFVVPRVFKKMGSTRASISKSKMGFVEGALGQFYMDCGRFPDETEGLQALLEAPADLEEKWAGAYIKRSQMFDSWDNPYIYVAEGMVNVGSYDLISFGADGVEGGEGDDEDIYNE